jgi:hypothetical protein
VDFLHDEPRPLGEWHRGEIEELGSVSCFHSICLGKLVNRLTIINHALFRHWHYCHSHMLKGPSWTFLRRHLKAFITQLHRGPYQGGRHLAAALCAGGGE